MAIKYKELNGLIYAQYDSQSEFAQKLGWPRQKLNKILMGTKEPDLRETAEIADGLNKPLDTIAAIFLRQ